MLTRGSARPTGGLSVSGIQSVTASSPLASSGGLNPDISLTPSNSTGGTYLDPPGFALPIGASGTFTKLQPASGGPWLAETGSSEFIIDPVSGLKDGGLQYKGTVSKTFLINGQATFSKAGATVSSQLAIFVNGTRHPTPSAFNDVSTRKTTRAATPVVVLLAPDDVIDMRVTNEDNTDSFVVESATLTAISGGVI